MTTRPTFHPRTRRFIRTPWIYSMTRDGPQIHWHGGPSTCFSLARSHTDIDFLDNSLNAIRYLVRNELLHMAQTRTSPVPPPCSPFTSTIIRRVLLYYPCPPCMCVSPHECISSLWCPVECRVSNAIISYFLMKKMCAFW